MKLVIISEYVCSHILVNIGLRIRVFTVQKKKKMNKNHAVLIDLGPLSSSILLVRLHWFSALQLGMCTCMWTIIMHLLVRRGNCLLPLLIDENDYDIVDVLKYLNASTPFDVNVGSFESP